MEPTRNRQLIVVSMHDALGISGVGVAGARMAALKRPDAKWVPMVVGTHEEVTDENIANSPLGGVEELCAATWPKDASPVQQVLTVREALRTLSADVVVTNDCPHGFIAGALDGYRGLRTALSHHGSGRDGMDVLYRCGVLADVWCAVSGELTQRVRGLRVMRGEPCSQAMPVYVDIDEEPAPWLPNTRTLRLIYAGRIANRNKQAMDLVRLADELFARGVRFRLTIVGEGPAESALRAASGGHLKAGRVAIVGKVGTPRMKDVFAAHDVGILVSESEGMPLVVAECMAAGRAVAITRGCGGALELVRDGENGIIVDTGDINAMAERLQQLSIKRDRIGIMGQAAFETAKRMCGVTAIQDRYAAFVQAAVDAHPMEVSDVWNGVLRALGAIGECSVEQIVQLRDLWAAELSSPALGGPVVPTGSAATAWSCEQVHVACSAERRMTAALMELRLSGKRRIGLYGAGAHTRRLRACFAASKDIIAIVDDRAGEVGSGAGSGAGGGAGPPDVMFGVPVVTPVRAVELGLDALVMSSDEYEVAMAARARGWCGGAQVVMLYANNSEDRSVRSEAA